MDEIILLGLRTQINQRNDTVDALTRLLNEMRIFPTGIDDIIIEYIHGSPMRIDPAMGDRFLNRKYFASYEQISVRFEVVISDCRSCFGNCYNVKFYSLFNGYPISLTMPVICAWNHVFSGYDGTLVDRIAEWISDNVLDGTMQCESYSFEKTARCILDNIRMQILAPDDKKM